MKYSVVVSRYDPEKLCFSSRACVIFGGNFELSTVHTQQTFTHRTCTQIFLECLCDSVLGNAAFWASPFPNPYCFGHPLFILLQHFGHLPVPSRDAQIV